MINLKNLIDFLPFEYKAQDTYKVNGKGILERFLEICGEHFEDYITKDIENILDIIDIDKANGFDFSLDIQNNNYQSGYRYSITVSEPNHDYEDPGFNLPVFENASQLTLTVKEIV